MSTQQQPPEGTVHSAYLSHDPDLSIRWREPYGGGEISFRVHFWGFIAGSWEEYNKDFPPTIRGFDQAWMFAQQVLRDYKALSAPKDTSSLEAALRSTQRLLEGAEKEAARLSQIAQRECERVDGYRREQASIEERINRLTGTEDIEAFKGRFS